jgi:ABC-type antimicrobial peptide transport system ATPase subunit
MKGFQRTQPLMDCPEGYQTIVSEKDIRLYTLHNANKIMVMDKGEIVESGTDEKEGALSPAVHIEESAN